jgi:hypothetical protein
VGCDCTNYFPKGTKEADVEEFLYLLGFKRGKKGPFSGMMGKPFYFDKDDDYRHITGLYIELYRDKEDSAQLKLWTRTEPPRFLRRLQSLRGLSHEEVEQVLT